MTPGHVVCFGEAEDCDVSLANKLCAVYVLSESTIVDGVKVDCVGV